MLNGCTSFFKHTYRITDIFCDSTIFAIVLKTQKMQKFKIFGSTMITAHLIAVQVYGDLIHIPFDYISNMYSRPRDGKIVIVYSLVDVSILRFVKNRVW